MASQQLLNAQKQLQQLRQKNGIAATTIVGEGPRALPPTIQFTIIPAASTAQPQELERINHHGDIALAALRSGESCHYQLWLALRLLDATGSGHVALSAAKDALTEESSDSFMYQVPRLKQLLAEGNGRFWHIDEERLWLRSTVRVAHVLGVTRLNGRFFTIAKDEIVGGTAVFRAHCYAAWLSNHTNPMSQATIERLTGLTPRTQRRYCQLANIEVQQNITIGPAAHTADRQEIAWQHGNTFEFTDYRGQQGPAHRRYIAWHLPANYAVNGPQGSRRQQKRHNQQLAGLATTETPGNGQFAGTRLFFANGKAAAKAYNRQMSGETTDIYWQQRRAKSGTGIWNVIGGHAAAIQSRSTA